MEVSLMSIPKDVLQEIISTWRNNGEKDYLSKFNDLLADCTYQFDDIWFYRLTKTCLAMELDYNSYESQYICPVLTAYCRLVKSSFFKSHSSDTDLLDLHKKIKLFKRYFEKVFSVEDSEAVELFLDVYRCLKECPCFIDVNMDHEASLLVVLRKLMLKTNEQIDITVKRAMLQLINFFIEEIGTSDTILNESDLEEFVYEYPNSLRICGDYDFQFAYTEAIIRLSQYFPRRDIGLRLACDDSALFESFMSIHGKDFDKTCRMFLNTFNSGESTSLNKVFSFPCIALSFGKIPLNVDTDSDSLWIDVNEGSSCISFSCDISADLRNDQLVPLFLASTDIHHVSTAYINITKGEVSSLNLTFKVELRKACGEYPISQFDHFKTLEGNTVVFIFEEHVKLSCISQAFNSIGLSLHKCLSQELASGGSFEAKILGLSKASIVSFPICIDGNEEMRSSITFEANETLAIEYTTSGGENVKKSSHEIISSSKASVADGLAIFDSQETIPYIFLNTSKQNSASENLDELEKIRDGQSLANFDSQETIPHPCTCTYEQIPSSLIPDEVEKLSDDMDGNTITSCTQRVENYLMGLSQEKDKASLTVDVVKCHGISMWQDEMSTFHLGSPDEETGIAENPVLQDPVRNVVSFSVITDDTVPSKEQDANSKNESNQLVSNKNECHVLKTPNKRKNKTLHTIPIGSLHKGMMESSSEGEFTETHCKRKCKRTTKRKNKPHLRKITKNRLTSSSSGENSHSEQFKWNLHKIIHSFDSLTDDGTHSEGVDSSCFSFEKQKPATDAKSTNEDNRKYRFHVGSEKKNEFDYGFHFTEDGDIFVPEMSLIDATNQRTLETIEISQNKFLNTEPLFCNKSTMCSPGLFSGPSSTVRPQFNIEQSCERIADVEDGVFQLDTLTTVTPLNTFRRRLSFDETYSQQPNTTNEIDAYLHKDIGSEQLEYSLDNSNAIRDFGKKISTTFSKKLAELSMKQISSMKCIFSDLKTTWEDQLKTTSMEMEEQMISHLNSIILHFQRNLKMKLNLQNQQEHSARVAMDGYETFLNDMKTMQKEILTSTKSTENELESDVSLAVQNMRH